FDRINATFGTALSSSHVRVEVAGPPNPGGWSMLRDHLLLKRARRMAPAFDLVVTAHNESDLGRPAIQYIHFPKYFDGRADAVRGYQSRAAVRLHQTACDPATGFSRTRMRANLTLVNSAWTGRLIHELHGIEPVTLNPPSGDAVPDVPWKNRRLAVA